jgi:hypothetical protein
MEAVMPYAKFVVAILGSGVTAALGLIGPGTDLFIVLTVLAAMLTSAGVFFIPNLPDGTGKRRAA